VVAIARLSFPGCGFVERLVQENGISTVILEFVPWNETVDLKFVPCPIVHCAVFLTSYNWNFLKLNTSRTRQVLHVEAQWHDVVM